jgi:hypothetical protein
LESCVVNAMTFLRTLERGHTHPVKNRLPMLAPEKSKVELGRSRFRISKLTMFNTARISSFSADEISVQRACSASRICSHSVFAATLSFGSRWLKKTLIAAFLRSSSWSGMRRTSRPVVIRSDTFHVAISDTQRLWTYSLRHRCLRLSALGISRCEVSADLDRQTLVSVPMSFHHCH